MATMTKKRGKSIEDLALAAKREAAETPDDRLKRQLREFVKARGHELDEEDREWALRVATSAWPYNVSQLLTSDRTRAVLLLARQPATNGKANGHANGHAKANGQKPAIAGPALGADETAATVPAGIAKRHAEPNGHAKPNGTPVGVGEPTLDTPPRSLSDVELQQRLRKIFEVAAGSIDPHARLRISDLVASIKWKPKERKEAEQLAEEHGKLLKNRTLSRNNQAREPGDWKADLRATLRANRPVPERFVAAVEDGLDVEIPIDDCQPHPENRDSSDKDPDVVELGESIKEHGLLQAITVRPTCVAEREAMQGKTFEIIVGERRWRGCRIAGRKTVRAKIRTDLSDAQVVRLMAIENAKRKNLNPIERAKLIEQLCRPADQGGAGLTLDAAAKDVGLADPASASNCRRLLKLPQVWQDRVAGGELPESWARLLLPYLELPPVMNELEENWKVRDDAEPWEDNPFTSRKNLESELPAMVDRECRRLDQERYTSRGYVRPKIDRENAELANSLGIVEVEMPSGRKGKLAKVAVATNVKAFDELVKKQADRGSKAEAAKAGSDKPEKRELSPAEKKQAAANRARQLGERIAAWRHKLLRRACVQAIEAGLDSGLRIVLAFAADQGNLPYDALRFGGALEEVRGVKRRERMYRGEFWPCVAGVAAADEEGEVIAALAKRILADEFKDWRRPTLPHSLVESYAAAIDVKLPQAWANLRSDLDMLEEFFLLHGTEPLRELGKELGVFLGHASTRGAMVKLLLGKVTGTSLGMPLPLPKCIKPLPAATKGKGAAKKAKGGKGRR
jgi:ParB/RepB/Spo0J family partition protein